MLRKVVTTLRAAWLLMPEGFPGEAAVAIFRSWANQWCPDVELP
jgi:hypothetical protein